MKKANLNGKLSLKKETIAKLNDEQMNVIKGGTNGHGCPSDLGSCPSNRVTCVSCGVANTCGC